MELSHWRVMLRTDEKLDFKSIPEGGRFSFDDYNTVAELRFTRELISKFNNNAERILSACFQYTNSFDEPWYDYTGDEYVKINSFMKPCRSSSVGDIFQNMNENKYWMIAPLGFVRVYPPVDVYLEMARRRRERKDAESFEVKKRVEKATEEYTPSLEDILDFVHQQFSQGVLQLRYEEIAQYFRIDKQEVNLILNEDNKLRKKYAVDGEPAFGDYFLRYKEMPMQSAYSNGSVFYSIKNPFIQARAKGRSFDNKKMRKDRLRKIMFGAEDLTFCPTCYTDSREKKTYYPPNTDDVREWAYYVCKNNWCRGKPSEPQPIEDERLEGAECYMCGEGANYIFEDLPTGAKPFCTEKCLCDYAGYPYMGEGYYGLRPIGGESFNVRRVLQNTGRLDWRM